MMMRFIAFFTAILSLLAGIDAYWLEDITHQGRAPYAVSGYPVFRNVMDYGATGNGVTDDTAAINAAIAAGGDRCDQGCDSTTTTPAVVYFPAGTYLISGSIYPYYFTQLIGDPTSPATIKATSNFANTALIDGNPYYSSDPNWVTTNVFYSQVRNLILDTTSIPPGTLAWGMHWPTSQATSLQNVVFNMPTTSGVTHIGLFVESGSGGFMSDLVFNGGSIGADFGNQQYTTRNLTFNNCVTAINQLWNWGWTYIGLSINNCGTGIDMTNGGSTSQEVGSITVIDSTFANTEVGISTAYSSSSSPAAAGGIVLENVNLDNVPVMVQGASGTALTGSTGALTVAGWSEGHTYLPTGPQTVQGITTPNTRPSVLLDGSNYYTRSKPQYETLDASSIVSVRTAGAVGDGTTDDTAAIQSAINSAAASGSLVYIDYGLYKITSPILIPPGSKITGESYPVLMAAAGTYWSDVDVPQPFIQVGSTSGEAGSVELSNFIVSTLGSAPGAVLIEWNLASSGTIGGMWDVHARVGGYTGSGLQVAECPKAPGDSTVNTNCIASYMSMHVTEAASGVYLENVWLWVADHDIDDASNTQITVYSGRGLLVESTNGPVWLYGTAVEHHALYQYQFVNAKNVFASELQTETPYYQPTPNAEAVFTPNTTLSDPDFSTSCAGASANCAMAWGLRVLDSSDLLIYGAGHYSWFSSYVQDCTTFDTGEDCQQNIVSLEGTNSNINIYNLNTIGSTSMITQDGTSLASWTDNEGVYPAAIAIFRSG
ncbi:pectate lyase superfamily protein-domain-containing protein [Xylariales sp. PMI_506]|nr:pectate lyase superfamily protein-domain-containing protein [Xylariales sp. PMI_506]